jgi:hypothetical protein
MVRVVSILECFPFNKEALLLALFISMLMFWILVLCRLIEDGDGMSV